MITGLAPRVSTEAVTVAAGSDATVYTPPLKKLYVGTTGNITIITPSGVSVVLTGVLSGSLINDVYASKVMATGTTASNMTGWQ